MRHKNELLGLNSWLMVYFSPVIQSKSIPLNITQHTYIVNKISVVFQLIFYYGATDHWCPIQYYLDIKKDFPHGDIRLCENGFRHAFVLDTGREVAKMVVEWISGDLTTQVL